MHIHENGVLFLPFGEMLQALWSRPYFGLYIPLTYTVWGVLVRLSTEAWAFHLTNVLFHFINIGLVFVLAKKLYKSVEPDRVDESRQTLFALTTAAVFALLPVQASNVAWVSGLKDILFTSFALLCLGAFLEQRRVWTWAFFILSLTVKPTAVVLPLLGFVFYALIPRLRRRENVVSLSAMSVLSLFVILVTASLQAAHTQEIWIPWGKRAFVALDALAFYLKQLVFSVTHAIDYGRSPEFLFTQNDWRWTWVVPVLGAIALVRYRQHKLIILGALFFVLGLLPVLGLVPFAHQKFSTVADRYLYFPVLGFALVLADLVSRLQPKRALFLVSALVLTWSGLLAYNLLPYRNDFTLFTRLLEVNPRAYDGYFKLGMVEMSRGNAVEAERLMRISIEKNPHYKDAQNNLGNILATRGDFKGAIEQFQKTLQLDPTHAPAQLNLGQALLLQGDFHEAVKVFHGILSQNRSRGDILEKLSTALENIKDKSAEENFIQGNVFMMQQKPQEALMSLLAAVKRDPSHAPSHNNLANLYNKLGQKELAKKHYIQALKQDVTNPEVRHNLTQMIREELRL